MTRTPPTTTHHPYDPLAAATAGRQKIPPDWMPASATRSLIQSDPGVIWLEWYGDKLGFRQDKSEYSFDDFVLAKGRALEKKWLEEFAAGAPRVCEHDYEVHMVEKLRETLNLMKARQAIIVHPAIWWGPEKIFGVPDLIVLSTWLNEHFSGVIQSNEVTPGHMLSEGEGHYVAADIKVKTKLNEDKTALAIATSQLEIYSYILGHLQGYMPQSALAFCRDCVAAPIVIPITSRLTESLGSPNAEYRVHWSDIRGNGEKYVPWQDPVVEVNLGCATEEWGSAKKVIATERTPGGDPTQVFRITLPHKHTLSTLGINSLNDMLAMDPQNVPLDKCKGIGSGTFARQIRAILQANRTGRPVRPSAPPRKLAHEFFVDYEYFDNLNFDCDKQWPTLEGCEMVFMVGVSFEQNGKLLHKSFVAEIESHEAERQIMLDFAAFMQGIVGRDLSDPNATAIYHWTPPEQWQTVKAADRANLPPDHVLRHLPWIDLCKTFSDGPIAIPGALTFKLKHVANALGAMDAAYDPKWPEELAEGLQAMVMAWRAFASGDAKSSKELPLLVQYLEADCRALWQILRWLRS